MPENFGARLRQQRESRQIPLETISAQTKINIALLEGLERGDLSRWPVGIFRRSFIRDYARTIGLQPEAVVREFLEHYPDPLEEPLTALSEAGDPMAVATAPPTRFRHLFGAAVGSFSRLRPAIGQRDAAPACDPPVRAPATPSAAFDVAPAPNATPVGAAGVLGDPASESVAEPRMTLEAMPLSEPELSSAPPHGAPPEPEPEPPAMAELDLPLTSVLPGLAELDLSAIARLSTCLGRTDEAGDLPPLLAEASRLMGAAGLIVWAWSPSASALTAALAHGYPDAMVARLPQVACDAPNATAAAFRSGEMRTVDGGDLASDALVVPLLTAAGCPGVLAIELPHGEARRESTQAFATIFAAQIGRFVRLSGSAAAGDRRFA
jgi:hypothetical protein